MMWYLFIFQLRRAVVDHVSDSFLETTMPLIMMIEAAQAGNEREVEDCAKLFIDHAAKLEEVRQKNLISKTEPEYCVATENIHTSTMEFQVYLHTFPLKFWLMRPPPPQNLQ